MKRAYKGSISFRLEQNGEYERAAATALFNNQMRLAIDILSGRSVRDVKSDNGPRGDRPPPGKSLGISTIQ